MIEIRRLPGAWDKLKRTLTALVALRERHPGLILGLKTTIVPENIAELDKIAAYAAEHRLFTIISPRIITANRFGNRELAGQFSFSESDLSVMQNFLSGPAAGWGGHAETLRHYLAGREADKPCSAGFNTVFVRYNGDVFPCPLIPQRWGRLQTASLAKMLTSAQAREFRPQIRRLVECRSCTEPGLERLAWLYEGRCCLRRLVRRGYQDTSRMLAELGLDKYL